MTCISTRELLRITIGQWYIQTSVYPLPVVHGFGAEFTALAVMEMVRQC